MILPPSLYGNSFQPAPPSGRGGNIPKRLFLFSYWSSHHKSAPTPYSIQDSNVSFVDASTTMKITGLARTNTGRIRFLHFDRPHGDSEPGAARQGLVNTTRIDLELGCTQYCDRKAAFAMARKC